MEGTEKGKERRDKKRREWNEIKGKKWRSMKMNREKRSGMRERGKK